jgi:dienelactone hydrolase
VGVSTSFTTGMVITGQSDTLCIPRGGCNPRRYPVIICHGAGGVTTNMISGASFTAVPDRNGYGFIETLAAHGLASITPELAGDNWGNDGCSGPGGLIDDYAAYMVSLGCRPGKVLLLGGSMGFITAQNYVAQHPGGVAALVGVIPGQNIDDLRDNNRAGTQTAINTAWGITPLTATSATVPLPARANPTNPAQRALIAAAGCPIRYYYSTADSVVLPQYETAQAAALLALGAQVTALVTSTTLDHSVASISTVDCVGDVLPFFLAHA